MRRYRFLTPAYKDLAQILEYLNSNSRSAAASFLEGLDHRLNLLADFPLSGSERPEFGQPSLRFTIYASYLIAYYPEGRPLRIAAILHGSRDLPTALKWS